MTRFALQAILCHFLTRFCPTASRFMTDRVKTKPIRMKVSAQLYDYLGVLAKRTILGTSENGVAEYILTKQLERMLAAKYHETEVPPST